MPAPLTALALLGLLTPGCAAPEPAVPDAPALSVDQLRFALPAEAARYRAVRAGAVARTTGWRHQPLERLGNFVEERWCGPGVSEVACAGGGVANEERRGTRWLTLSTYHYPPRWPEVFGVGLAGGVLPETGDWGVWASFVEGGGTVAGDGVVVTALRLGPDGVTERHPLLPWSLTVAATEVALPGVDAAADLRALLASPASLRARVTERLAALEAEVAAALASGRVQRAQDGPYRGGGVPPERTLVALTPGEAEAAGAEAVATLRARSTAVAAGAEALHPLLVAVLGPEG